MPNMHFFKVFCEDFYADKIRRRDYGILGIYAVLRSADSVHHSNRARSSEKL